MCQILGKRSSRADEGKCVRLRRGNWIDEERCVKEIEKRQEGWWGEVCQILGKRSSRADEGKCVRLRRGNWIDEERCVKEIEKRQEG